ncbi:hypothetical protein [Gemmata sp.]|uniref:hypothetical protein n=1 Tax=Gemmata sp. TaxID=1914242 RepID=UPI003F724D03
MTSGKYLTVRLGNMSPIAMPDNFAWSVDDDVKELERTVGADNGFGNVDGGVRRAAIQISFYVDISDVATIVTDCQPDNVLEYLKLYYRKDDAAPAYTFDEALVLKASLGAEVDGQFLLKVSLKNKGTFSVADPEGD